MGAPYLLQCWKTKARDTVQPFCIYSDSAAELRERAEAILDGGEYRYLALSRWIPGPDCWEERELFEAR